MLVTEQARPLLGQGAVTADLAARGSALLLAAILLLSGCTSVAEVTRTATQDELMRVRTDVTRLQQSVQRLQGSVDANVAASTTRTREQLQQTEQQVGALSRRLESLSTSVTTLSARVDELNARLDSQARQSRAVTSPPLGRPPSGSAPPAPIPPSGSAPPAPIPPSGSAPPAPIPPNVSAPPAPIPPNVSAPPAPIPPSTSVPPAPSPPPAASVSPVPRPSSPTAPQDAYQAAYIDFSKGSYLIAITGFRDFVRRYPDHPLAGSAQYWVGESQLGLARGQANAGQTERSTQAMEQAVQEFRKVVANYPRSDKAPSALYKEALVLIELKQPAVAQARLQYLVDNFPQAAETMLAREKLAALKER
jgi:tol-pal system protein YbgF